MIDNLGQSSAACYTKSIKGILGMGRRLRIESVNASLPLLPETGTQRTLEAVSCKALLGSDLMSPRSVLAKRAPGPRFHGETVPDTVAGIDPVWETACRFIPPAHMVLLHAVLASGGHREQATGDDHARRAGPVALIDRGPAFEEAETRWRATRA